MLKFATLTSATVLLAACASTPDVTYRYYPAKSTTTITVVQTIDCTKDGNSAIVTYGAPTISTTYDADFSQAPALVKVRSTGSTFADADMGDTLAEDGRLKAVNTTSTGQGSAIITAATSLVTALAKGGSETAGAHGPLLAHTPSHGNAAAPVTLCSKIKNWGNDKPLSLTYTYVGDLKSVYLDALRQHPPLPGQHEVNAPVNLKNADYVNVKGAFNDVVAPLDDTFGFAIHFNENLGGAYTECPANAADETVLHLQDTLNAHIEFRSGGGTYATGNTIVPGPAPYCLAMPQAEPFGGTKFALGLGDSGAITSVDYGNTNGMASALNAGTTIVNNVMPAPAAH